MTSAQIIGDTFLTARPQQIVRGDGFRFRHGQTLAPFTIVYETFGELNSDRSNAVLVCHALSASAHAAGKYSIDDDKAGWWDGMIGYGKAFDLNELFVVCVNFPGSSEGTTGPPSINPSTAEPYGSQFPWVTIEDMVEAEKLVVNHLGIDRLRAVAGGSLGGMQALMWCALYPDSVGSLITMAAAAAVPALGIAWHLIGRKVIEADHHFNGGDYYKAEDPLRGLEMARMVGHMTYLSAEALEEKFGRRRRRNSRQFEMDSYLEYQGQKFSRRYDANAYIRIQSAMDEMDLEEQYGSIQQALANFETPALLISFDTDWLFPTPEVRKISDALQSLGRDATLLEISTLRGHDAFLVDFDLITPPVRQFLRKLGPP